MKNFLWRAKTSNLTDVLRRDRINLKCTGELKKKTYGEGAIKMCMTYDWYIMFLKTTRRQKYKLSIYRFSCLTIFECFISQIRSA